MLAVLAMRKTTGEVTGEITLNGHPQEESSFRRCHGFVEQFDVQSPQLTIRETCEFSAKLRLEENDPAVTPESIAKFVDQALRMLELTAIQDLQVGSDESGGLSFEQRKRLSIAVELVANPSILFLGTFKQTTFLFCEIANPGLINALLPRRAHIWSGKFFEFVHSVPSMLLCCSFLKNGVIF